MAELTGARESNAGDDFHFNWAAKKSLKLLEPNTDLHAIYVEGASCSDNNIFTDDESVLLSIDVSEYFGSSEFNTAAKVIFSQLKYSTRHGNQAWTLSMLSTSTNSRRDNSILRRLATTYRGFYKGHEAIIGKLKLKLVSNRKIEESFLKLVNDSVQIALDPRISTYAEIKNLLDKDEKNVLKAMYEETKLKSSEFVGFLKSLDFSDCGTGIRDIQEAEVITELAQLGIINIKENYDKLLQFIRKQMTAEPNENKPINRNLMANFFNVIPSGLFPVSSNFVKTHNYVNRKMEDALVDSIVNKRESYICLHATGGMGKTTLISDIGLKLPEGSVTIKYDCYGGGAYLDPATPLHLYKRAIVQLSNELALKCYTPFLVASVMDESDYLYHFSTRLNQAAEYIKRLNSEAIILIILDAIDNSYKAASYFNQGCFVDKLLKISLPANVSIVVTSRTERLDLFELPYQTILFELKGFDIDEELEYLEKYFKNPKIEQVEDIIRLTNGNPRVQSYIFVKEFNNLDRAIECLSPNGMNLDGIFEQAMSMVDCRISSEMISFEELCCAIVELPRPIPVEIIIECTNYNIQELESICSEYLLGVYFSNGVVTFRDEDFEDYLKRTSKVKHEVIEKIATSLYQGRKRSYYSIRFLHIFLRKSGKLAELLDSIYEVDNIDLLLFEDERNEILSSRIKMAFEIEEIYNPEQYVDIYKLLYIQAKCSVAKSDIKEIIQENMSLIKKLDLEDSLKRFIDIKSGYDSLHDLTDLTYANILLGRVVQSDEYYGIAIEKIKEILNKKENERAFYHRIEITDISKLAFYLVQRKDVDIGISWLESWKPYPVEEYYELTKDLLMLSEIDKAEQLVTKSNNIDMLAPILKAFLDLGYEIKDEYLENVEILLGNKELKKIKEIDCKYKIDLAEILLKKKMRSVCKKLILSFRVYLPSTYISFHETETELPLKYVFRYYTLNKYLKNESYTFDDFIQLMTNNRKEYRNKDLNEVKKVLDFLINSFFIRIKIVSDESNEVTFKDFEQEYQHCDRYFYNFYNDHNGYGYYREVMFNIFGVLLKERKDIVKKYCVVFIKNRHLDNDFHFRVIEEIILDSRYLDLAGWYLLEIEKNMLQNPQSSYNMKVFYVMCSKLATTISVKLGKDYFIKAINAVNGMDVDAYKRISVYEKLARRYDDNKNADMLVYNLTRVIEDRFRRLDDRKHLPEDVIFKLLCLVYPSSAIASACRLEDRDDEYITFGYEHSLPFILLNLLKADVISPGVAVALANIDIDLNIGYSDIINIVLEKIKTKDVESQKNIIATIVRDIRQSTSGFHHSNTINKIQEWDVRNGKQNSNLEYEKYDFIKTYSDKEKVYGYDRNNRISWSDVNKNEFDYSKDSIMQVLEKLDYKDWGELINYILENADYRNQVEIVELIIEVMYSSRYLTQNPCAEILIAYMDEWEKYNPAITDWRKDEQNLDKIINLFEERASSFQEENIICISQMFKYQADKVINKLVRKAPVYLCLEPWEIYSYMEILSVIDSSENRTQVLTWCVEDELITVHEASSDEVFSPDKKNNFSVDDGLAVYIIKMLGHIEKKKRWYAMHTIYNLYKMGENNLISIIMERIFDDIPFLFKDKDYIYYKDAAIVCFFIALRKIAEEEVIFLYPYLSKFKEVAFSSNVINILQRELAKQIVIKLEPYNYDVKKVCDFVNKEKIPYQRVYRSKKKVRNTNFDFDSYDIIPYVYQYLGDIFQKSGEEVAVDCDSIISEWGVTNEIVRSWNKKFRTREYQQASHGYDISAEDLTKYIQYNAVFYVADQYRMTLAGTDDDTPIYTLESWIAQWLPRLNEVWGADLKSFPPDIKMFLDTQKYIKDKKYVIDKEIFEKAFCYGQFYILDADNVIEYEHSRKSHRLMVGVIKRNNISRLYKAAKQKNYQIAWNFITGRNMLEVDEFIEDLTDSYDCKEIGFEKYDPYLNGMSTYFIKLGEDLEKYLGIEGTKPLEYCENSDINMPAKAQYWCYQNEDRMYNFHCEGKILFIKRDCLKQYLLNQPDKVMVTQMNVRYSDGYKLYGEKSEAAERRIIQIWDNQLTELMDEIIVHVDHC